MNSLVSIGLALLLLSSALGVVYAKHTSRKLFVELQQLEARRDAMNVEWGQLQLEQSTLTTHGQVELFARERLGMGTPEPQSTVILHR
jgi:cell division protein FtsL